MMPMLSRQNKWIRLICVVLLALSGLIYMKSFTESPYSKNIKQDMYLTYLPHSGLSNQRIELANAIILAILLKRKLIVPPALLGFIKDEVATKSLQSYLSVITSPKATHCPDRVLGRIQTYMHKGQCTGYDKTAMVPWTALHSFSGLESHVQFEHVDTVSLESICERLQIHCEKDVQTFHSKRAFEWKVYENRTEALEVVKKQTNYMVTMMQGNISYAVWSLDHLRRSKRLLHFGDTFGSNLISLNSDHGWLRQQVAASLVYRLDTVFGRVALDIIKHLGGPKSFVSLHIRTGDTVFEDRLQKNLAHINDTLTHSRHYIPARANSPEALIRPLADCGPEKNRSLIYVATNQDNPRHPSSPLYSFFEQHPCAITLEDIPKRLFDPLDQSKGDILNPQKELRNFWIPLVDAIVAAHGVEFHGTPRSTFSSYIAQLNSHWTKETDKPSKT